MKLQVWARFALGILAVPFMAASALAAVLYENTGLGKSFDVTGDVGKGYGLYMKLPFESALGYPQFPVTNGYLLKDDVRWIRVKPVGGTPCDQIIAQNLTIIGESGNGIAQATGSRGIATGVYCDFYINYGSTAGKRFVAVAFCLTNGCNTANGSLVLDGSEINPGYVYDGTTTIGQKGGWAFQLCDIGGCTDFASPGDDEWALPVASPRVGQDFNCYGCVPTKSGKQLFHTGMDMTPTVGSAIVAPVRGKVHAVYRTRHSANAWCEGGVGRLDEVELSKHNFGNSIILSHITTGGQTIYTQYNHLSCLSKGVALRLLDRATLSEDQQLVNKQTFLGNFGNSDDTALNSGKWAPHLHFEVKTVGTLASGGNTGYASVSADTVGYRDPIEHLYSRQISAPDFSMGIVAVDGAKAYSAPGLNIDEGADLLSNSLPTGALVYIKRKAKMPDGDWFQINLGLPDMVYTVPCTPEACHDNIVPDGWVHGKYIVAYNGFLTEVPPPTGQLVSVYDTPAGKKIAQVLGSQAFQRYGQVPGSTKGKVKCSSYWVEIDLGAVQINPSTTLKRGWICAAPPSQ